jgi:hypothetical protein
MSTIESEGLNQTQLELIQFQKEEHEVDLWSIKILCPDNPNLVKTFEDCGQSNSELLEKFRATRPESQLSDNRIILDRIKELTASLRRERNRLKNEKERINNPIFRAVVFVRDFNKGTETREVERIKRVFSLLEEKLTVMNKLEQAFVGKCVQEETDQDVQCANF